MEIIKKLLGNVWNLVPGIIGFLQGVLPAVKEVLVIVARLVAILPFLWNTAGPIIEKINAVYAKIMEWIEKIKNMLLIS